MEPVSFLPRHQFRGLCEWLGTWYVLKVRSC